MPAVRIAAGLTVATTLTVPAAAEPVIWHLFGMPFQAGPLVVGLCAVAITRCIVFIQNTGRRQLALDIFVSLLCALVTAIWIQDDKLTMRGAGALGIGVASLGIGIVSIARGALPAGRMKAAWSGFISGTPEQHRQNGNVNGTVPDSVSQPLRQLPVDEVPDDLRDLVTRAGHSLDQVAPPPSEQSEAPPHYDTRPYTNPYGD